MHNTAAWMIVIYMASLHYHKTITVQGNPQLCLTWRGRSTNRSCLDVIPDSQNYHEDKFMPLGTENQYFELCLCTWCCFVTFVFFEPSCCVWTTGYFTHSCSKSNVTVLWDWKSKRQKACHMNSNTVSTTNECAFLTFIKVLYYFTKHNEQDSRHNTANSHSLTYTESQTSVHGKVTHFWAWHDLSYSATSD